jgi:hypothetical protein
MAARLSVLRAGRPLAPGRFLILISVPGWVDPRVTVRLEGLGQLKNPMTSSGAESATFRLVAQWTIKSINIFWAAKPHSPVEVYRRFGERTASIFWVEKEATQETRKKKRTPSRTYNSSIYKHSLRTFFSSGVGWDSVHLVRRPLIGLLYQSHMISMEHLLVWELAAETEVLGENLP